MSASSVQEKLVLKLCKSLEGKLSEDKIPRGLKDADKLIAAVITSDDLSPEALGKTKLAIFGLADYCARRGRILDATSLGEKLLNLGERVSGKSKDFIAHHIGRWFSRSGCYRNAARWFSIALQYARDGGEDYNDHTVMNLRELGQSLAELQLFESAIAAFRDIERIKDVASAKELSLHYMLECQMCHGLLELAHGNEQTGERLLSELTVLLTERQDGNIPWTFFTGWFELARYYNNSGRHDEAMTLARTVQGNVHRFDEKEDLSDICEGIVMDALRRSGKAPEACVLALKLLGESEIEKPRYRDGSLDYRYIWVTAARSFSEVRDYRKAISAYSTAALSFGGLCAEAQFSTTSSERLYWISHQSRIVHELVALWLTIPSGVHKNATEKCAANALLQLKANFYTALTRYRLDPQYRMMREFTGLDIEAASIAVDVRKAADQDISHTSALNLEMELCRRDENERETFGRGSDPVAISIVFDFDFSRSQVLREGVVSIDYSLVRIEPEASNPCGASSLHYVGVRMERGSLKIVDLGAESEIHALCEEWLSKLSIPSTDVAQLDALMRQSAEMYAALVAPFEPLGDELLISPEGILAAIPFAALRTRSKYLVELSKIATVHSLLHIENLNMRRMSPFTRLMPLSDSRATLIGAVEYEGTPYSPLPGSEEEINRVAKILRRTKGLAVTKLTKQVATSTAFLKCRQLEILHVAAHGEYSELPSIGMEHRADANEGWFRWHSGPRDRLSVLERSLLGARLILSPDEPGGVSSEVTGMDISLLDLYNCELCVLSACSTGVGRSTSGIGVLGFQHALACAFVKSAVVSLWQQSDEQTPELIEELYKSRLELKDWFGAYNAALRKFCSTSSVYSHPYYWAHLVFIHTPY